MIVKLTVKNFGTIRNNGATLSMVAVDGLENTGTTFNVDKYNINLLPIAIIFGNKSYKDGVRYYVAQDMTPAIEMIKRDNIYSDLGWNTEITLEFLAGDDIYCLKIARSDEDGIIETLARLGYSDEDGDELIYTRRGMLLKYGGNQSAGVDREKLVVLNPPDYLGIGNVKSWMDNLVVSSYDDLRNAFRSNFRSYKDSSKILVLNRMKPMHPFILRDQIEKYLEELEAMNGKKRTQVIFSTDSTDVVGSKMIRPDEIFMCDIDYTGDATLSSMSDFTAGNEVENRRLDLFREGRFGGIPTYDDNFDEFFTIYDKKVNS